MEIIFKTNLDNYSGSDFLRFYTSKIDGFNTLNIISVPRKGETIEVLDAVKYKFTSKHLPTRLEVTDVIYTESGVICELWYKQIDIEFAKLNNVNLF